MPGPGGKASCMPSWSSETRSSCSARKARDVRPECRDARPIVRGILSIRPGCRRRVQPGAGGRGATEVMPVQEMFWGDRSGHLKDPFGYSWNVATHTRDLSRDEIEKGRGGVHGAGRIYGAVVAEVGRHGDEDDRATVCLSGRARRLGAFKADLADFDGAVFHHVSRWHEDVTANAWRRVCPVGSLLGAFALLHLQHLRHHHSHRPPPFGGGGLFTVFQTSLPLTLRDMFQPFVYGVTEYDSFVPTSL